MKIAVVRGSAANPYELQNFEPLRDHLELTYVTSRRARLPYDEGTVLRLPEAGAWARVFPPPLAYLNQIRLAQKGRRGALRGLERVLPRFDVVHTVEISTATTLQVARHRKKAPFPRLVTTTWETLPFHDVGFGRFSGRNPQTRAEATAGVDVFLPVSSAAADALLVEGVEPHRIRVIPVGVDIHRFSPGPRPAGIRQAWGIGQDKLVVLFVGRITWTKGVYDLAHAAALLFQRAPEIRPHVIFAVVGAGPELSHLRRRVTELRLDDAFRWLPWQGYETMPSIYRMSDVFVLPSLPARGWQEQYGMAFAEAMASGLACIVAMSGALPEVAGGAALLVQPGSASELADHLQTVLTSDNRRRILSTAARSRAAKHLDRTRAASEYMKAYQSLLEER